MYINIYTYIYMYTYIYTYTYPCISLVQSASSYVPQKWKRIILLECACPVYNSGGELFTAAAIKTSFIKMVSTLYPHLLADHVCVV